MSRPAFVVALVALAVVLLAAAATALIILPAPVFSLALLALVVDEKSAHIVAASVVATVLALFVAPARARHLATACMLLCLGTVVVGVIPLAQGLRLASERRVDLDFGRYLRAPIDTEGPIQAERTVTYATVDGRALGLDIYVPRERPATATRAIVIAHGGGWSAGEKGEASLASRWLAGHGFTVFDVAYRTTPQPNWKTATGDLKCAVGWVKRHATTSEWNIDPTRLTLLGRSAGGHLALLSAYAPDDPRLPASCPEQVGGDGGTVESVIAMYAPTDLVWGYAHPVNPRVYDSSDRLRRFVGGPPEASGDLYRMLSPTERVTPQSPRTLLIHGGRDQLVGRQHTDMLAEKLHAAGVSYDTLIIPYAQHAFDFVFGGLSGQLAEAAILKFLGPPAAGGLDRR